MHDERRFDLLLQILIIHRLSVQFQVVLEQGPANFLGRGPKCEVLSSSGPNLASTENTVYEYIHEHLFYYVDMLEKTVGI